MARANRHHISGQVWHITHRCHKQEFLLKFSRDRKRWLHWLFEAKKRYGLQILNYAVTSNHIHLLVVDGNEEVIPKSLQLVAGKTAQEFNKRKKRKGAYWDDRYHATAIETGDQLLRCLVYIDLNMVRNGVVTHPSLWIHNGYNEIQNPPYRYSLIDREQLIACCGFRDDEQLRKEHRQWVTKSICSSEYAREPEWTESIAVRSKTFVNEIKEKLQLRVSSRKVMGLNDHYELREQEASYNAHFGTENMPLSPENTYCLDLSCE
ncbi:MAG: transposase [Desulfuromonadales bacterium]|nr:transposase [Desulfuromonadales bacterium]